MSFDPIVENDEPLSRTKKRKMALELTDLGKQLVSLPKSQLRQIPLDERVRSAVEAGQRITARVARKRQLHYIGKLLREVDPQPIRDKLAALAAPGIAERDRMHRLEAWRDYLLANGDDGLEELVAHAPAVDRQHFRQLLRTAARELKANKPPAAARKIFKALREFDQAEALPDNPPS